MTDHVNDERLDRTLRVLLDERAARLDGPMSPNDLVQRLSANGPRMHVLVRPLVRTPATVVLLITLLLLLTAVGLFVGSRLNSLPYRSSGGDTNGAIAVSANPWIYGGGQNGDIYLVVPGESPRRVIGEDDDGLAQACPAYSPDGTMLAYAEATASGPVTTFRGDWKVPDRAVVVVSVNASGEPGANLLRVPVDAGAGAMPCPTWAPDGRHLSYPVDREPGSPGYACSEAKGCSRSTAAALSELWITDVATSDTRIVRVGMPGRRAVWSPDAYRLAVPGSQQIVLIRPNGDVLTSIPVDANTTSVPGWTAEDDVAYLASPSQFGDDSVLRVVKADGSNDIRLTEAASEPGVTDYVESAALSPDGNRIVYAMGSRRCSDSGCEPGPLRALRMSSLRPGELAPSDIDTSYQGELTWSPDGTRLLVSSIDGIVSLRTDGTGVAELLARANDLNLEWSSGEVTWQPVRP